MFHLLTIILVVLKDLNLISWPWLWVLMPSIVGLTVVGIITLLVILGTWLWR